MHFLPRGHCHPRGAISSELEEGGPMRHARFASLFAQTAVLVLLGGVPVDQGVPGLCATPS